MKNGNRVYFSNKRIDRMIDKIDNMLDLQPVKSPARLKRLQIMKSSNNGVIRIKRG